MTAEERGEPVRSCPPPDVSVVVATRNRRPLLAEAVASVLAQTGGALELIVVDDCSSDDTLEWLASLGDERLRVLAMSEHGERSAARNLGLAAAVAPWVLFLDDDDLLPPGALATLSGHARSAHHEVAAVAGQRLIFDETGITDLQSPLNRRVRRRHEGPLWAELDGCEDLVGGMVLFRTEATTAVGGFHEKLTFSEDHHLLWRLAAEGWSWILLPERTLLSRTHAGQQAYPQGTERVARTATIEALRHECALLGPKPDRRVSAWRHLREARAEGGDTPRGQVLREAVSALRADPSVLGSSLFRAETAHLVARAALPKSAVSGLRRLRH